MRRPHDPISLIVWTLFIGTILTIGLWYSAGVLGAGELVAVLIWPVWILTGIVTSVGVVAAGVRNGMAHALLDRDEEARRQREGLSR